MFNFLSPINITSYGMTGLNICKALHAKNIEFSLFPVPSLKHVNFESQPLQCIYDGLEHAKMYDPKAPSVRLWHQHQLDQFVGTGPRIGFPIFELDKFSDHEKHHLSNVDALFVPTQWAKYIIEENGINVPTYVVPLGVDGTVFYERKNVRRPSEYTFLNVGKLEIRKGHDILCELFNEAFEEEDNVQLLVAFDNLGLGPEEHQEWMKKYKESPLGNKIDFVHRLQTQNDMAALLSSVDCLVQPSRAEGWNLPLLEAMACNRPVITTNYSAHTEFCNKSNAFLVDIDETETAHDGRYFFGQGNWAKIGDPQKDQFIEHMRHCYKNRISGNPSGESTAFALSWDNTCNQLLKNLEIAQSV